PVAAERFARGAYATIYLAPRDYHRVHTPLAGRLTAVRYVPGRRFSVNEATACGIRNLFCRNERVVCWFDTDGDTGGGAMALVLVGALNVSSIALADRGEIPSGRAWYSVEPEPRLYAKGAEIARFNLGSTVIVLFPAGEVEWDARLDSGRALRLGEAIGKRVGAARPESRERA
ncbi:MAG TPA: archaetidylserine decarboxylase, partial [Gammaproteobacteria bacterium]|nr:archaetidylserine decarboxylase [Gammaproteobacteria bacterium]